MNKRLPISLALGLTYCSLLQAGSSLSTAKNAKNKEEPIKSIKQNETPTKGLFKRRAGYWSKPSDEKLAGFFSKLTNPKSQREDWYTVSPYIAEFWCTISNIGFLYAGIEYNAPELVFAGTASVVSHAIPKQWLNTVDKIGVAVALSRVTRTYETLIEHPSLLLLVGLAGVINCTDTYLARTKGKTWPHVV